MIENIKDFISADEARQLAKEYRRSEETRRCTEELIDRLHIFPDIRAAAAAGAHEVGETYGDDQPYQIPLHIFNILGENLFGFFLRNKYQLEVRQHDKKGVVYLVISWKGNEPFLDRELIQLLQKEG